MWPFKRNKKSARENLKQVYYYKNDFITLKTLSKEAKTSMTRLTHDILVMYLGYKYGDATGDIKRLQRDLDLVTDECRKTRDELKLYKEKFGEIIA